MKNSNLLSFILGFMLLMLLSAKSFQERPTITTQAKPTGYHIKSFSSYDTRYTVEQHITSFYRKGYVLKSNSMFGDKDSFDGAIVVMEKY